MPVKTWVGRFAIVGGQAQEEGPYLRSFPRHRPDEEEDELYVLVEPASDDGDEYCGQLAEVIGRGYHEDTLSLTGGVLRAVQAAHRQLRDWNERSLRDHRVGAGLNCLVVRGRTAYLAQVGPAVAFHVGDGHFREVQPDDGAADPLGIVENVEPHFSRYDLSPGDLVLLASPRIKELLDEDALRSILLRGAEDALVELFRVAREQEEFSMVLLACVVEPEGAPEVQPNGRLVDAEGVAAANGAGAEGSVGGGEAAPAPEEQDADTSAAAPVEANPPTAVLDPAGAGAEVGGSSAGVEPPAGLTQPKLRLKGSGSNIRYPRTTGLRFSVPNVPPILLAGIAALVVIGLVAWFALPSALEDSREDQFVSLIEEASIALDSALRTEDPGQRRVLLQGADVKLTEAEGRRADAPEAVALRSRLDAAVVDLNAEVVLPDPELVVDVSERVPGAVSLGSLTIGGGGAYLLDQEQQRVIAISLLAPSAEPIVLFQAGSLVGTEVAGPPQIITWAEELGSLLILDDARRLISVVPGEAPQLIAVRDAAAWGSADGIAHSGGSLFVLDKAEHQVWRYLPSEFGFDSEREAMLGDADLAETAELAVSDSIYLLSEDGGVHRYQGGVEVEFSQGAGIDRPIAAAASLVPLPASGRLLVADRGNRRIVIFSEDGAFEQQLVSPSTFTDLRAVAVDEPNGFLYIQDGGALYRTALPAPK